MCIVFTAFVSEMPISMQLLCASVCLTALRELCCITSYQANSSHGTISFEIVVKICQSALAHSSTGRAYSTNIYIRTNSQAIRTYAFVGHIVFEMRVMEVEERE